MRKRGEDRKKGENEAETRVSERERDGGLERGRKGRTGRWEKTDNREKEGDERIGRSSEAKDRGRGGV